MRLTNDKCQEFLLFRGIKLINSFVISAKLQRIIESSAYEKNEINYALENTDKNDVILELGAGIGAVSTIILAHNQVKRYICVEADPRLIPLIKKNHSINNIDNVVVMSGVMTNKPDTQELSFYVREDFWGSSLKKPVHFDSKEIKVKGYNFAELLRAYQPTFLICDIEGGEFELFAKDVDLTSVQKVCIEVHNAPPKTLVDLYAFFIDQGFYLKNTPFKTGVSFFHRKFA